MVLEGRGGERFVGQSEGLGSPAGSLRCAAAAATVALQSAVGGTATLELLGVKAVRAFDAIVVIVSISLRNHEARRLVGSCLSSDQVERGAVLAVLNATNRLLGNVVFMR